MKRLALALCLFVLCGLSIAAQTNQTFVVIPSNATPTVVGIPLDAAPGFSSGSVALNGTTKAEFYFPADAMFGREVTVGQVQSMSYWTKNGTTHTVDPRDWFLAIYTKPYAGQSGGGWYGVRLGAEPYFAANMFDPANTWIQWSTGGPSNQLRWFESTYGYFGSYADPDWATFIAGNSLPGIRGPGVPYGSQPILLFSVQTGSGWSAGFHGQVDGFTVTLTDGSTARVNFEAVLIVPVTDKESCKDGGWKTALRADGSGFRNQGDCVSYTTAGK